MVELKSIIKRLDDLLFKYGIKPQNIKPASIKDINERLSKMEV